MSLTKRSLIYTLALIGLGAGFFVSKTYFSQQQINLKHFHGTYLKNPRPIQAFSIEGIDSKPFDNSKLLGHWTLMFFGFTSCGYLCPTTMAKVAHMFRILEQEKVPLPSLVMISVDPERDSLEKLKTYVQAFHPNFYAARGRDADIEKMTRELGIAYTKIKAKNSENKQYNIEHSGTLILFNPEGQLSAFFTLPHHAKHLAKDYRLISKN